MEEKFKNDFDGFTNLFNNLVEKDDFRSWLIESGFFNKFTQFANYKYDIVKINNVVNVQYTFDFDIGYRLKELDMKYICELIKDSIWYEMVNYNITMMNSENERGLFKQLTVPKFHNQVRFYIPFKI